MKKILIIALTTVLISTLTACTDKKKTDNKSQTEVKVKENTKDLKNKAEEAEKRRLDSIRQVKEHGHAH